MVNDASMVPFQMPFFEESSTLPHINSSNISYFQEYPWIIQDPLDFKYKYLGYVLPLFLVEASYQDIKKSSID